MFYAYRRSRLHSWTTLLAVICHVITVCMQQLVKFIIIIIIFLIYILRRILVYVCLYGMYVHMYVCEEFESIYCQLCVIM